MADHPRSEHVYFDAPAPSAPAEGWWSRYAAQLTNLTPTARAALEADCHYVVERGILGDGAPDPASWPSSRVRTGLVMGSVQSGKTASMLGVSAMGLDRGVDIVVVLAGTRLSLWRQTYERLAAQLDAGEENASKFRRRLLVPPPGVVLSEDSARLVDTYRMEPAGVRRTLSRGNPIIIVAMKHTDHLHALARSLRTDVFGAVRALERPAHMLVLDDEADDGSILDAVVEAGRDPVFGNLKQVPRAIANLWDPADPAPDNLFATYIAYTATPQANLLQEDHNPLAPRDFLISLRTPLDIGHPVDPTDVTDLEAPRSSTYPEPAGIGSYYTGGEVFYRRGHAADLCVPTTGNADEDLADAVRAYLVAGAIRLHRSGRTGPRSALQALYPTREAASAATPAPHSMLIHPSANIDAHFRSAEDVLTWAGIPDREAARELLETGEARLPEALVDRLDTEPDTWAVWLDRYLSSAQAIESEFNLLAPRTIPTWDQVKALLATEVIPGTRVSVVNSDPSADDRPMYRPTLDPDTGQWRPARDLSTIFVSGNVMARGLTLEGMTTALFQRASNNPLADTQMQMQRWFGYRGDYVELCRVFAPDPQLDLFRAYHDIDEAVRIAITEKMMGGAPEPAVLQGMGFLATGKIANLGNKPLSLGATPFVPVINSGQEPDPNVELVGDLFEASASTELILGNRLLGRSLDEPLTLGEAADLLDRLAFDAYQPGTDHQVGMHWARVEADLAAIQPLVDPGLYRAPSPTTGEPDPVRRDDPYSIPAYLRFWSACLNRPVRGLFITGAPAALWSMADLGLKTRQQPRFWVGIRYGRGVPVTSGPLSGLPTPVRTTTKDVQGGKIMTKWGSNDPDADPTEYRGDTFFDYYHRGEPLPRSSSDSSWRPAGSDGQILFYVNQLPDQPHPALAVGVCIPAGGPEQFAATKAAALPIT
ncbi:MAG: Z1 domain-containing protein [Corynebacterium sp.]|uniref:Z1 domain-containing protein n=1 Tax=Corynebacterium sp. TaxID=1720 RepID=UPI0026DF29B0|nr:Z1 domain-containing protein [Corynebacterium sp.]MDO5670113.1 Z1 domain-containing protein [Corynebacterium sp.]